MKPLRPDVENTNKLTINIVDGNEGPLVWLSGPVDIDSSPIFRDQLLALLKRRNTRVSIDLSAVTKLDSSGLATLVEALRIAHAGKTGLRLQGLHDGLLRMFQVTGLVALFDGSSQTMTQSGREVV